MFDSHAGWLGGPIFSLSHCTKKQILFRCTVSVGNGKGKKAWTQRNPFQEFLSMLLNLANFRSKYLGSLSLSYLSCALFKKPIPNLKRHWLVTLMVLTH